MADVTWLALRDRFPFGEPVEELGTVRAPDRATAMQRATALYGRGVVVRSVLAAEAARREKVGPGKIIRRKKPMTEDAYTARYRQFAASKRAAATQQRTTDAQRALPGIDTLTTERGSRA